MTVTSLPVCRHRGEERTPGVFPCRSPKLVGLKLVREETCQTCYCRDHEPVAAADRPPPLLPCAYLGPVVSQVLCPPT